MKMFGFYLTLLLSALGLVSANGRETFNYDDNTIDSYQQILKLRHLAFEFFEFYENFNSTDLIVPPTKTPNVQDLRCLAEMEQLRQGFQSGSIWALKMIDSWGRLPAGVLQGNLRDLGNFDECMRVNRALETGHTLRGKYCSAKVISGSILGGSPVLNLINIQTAICFPASCSGQHIDTLLRQVLEKLLSIQIDADYQLINENTCQTSESEPLDGLAIFTLVLLGMLVGIMLLCTLFDYFFCQDQKKLPVLVQVFSARVNSRGLFRVVDSKMNPNVIDCLHGIRCMSLIWVVYGHDYTLVGTSPLINLFDLLSWTESAYSMIITHALFAVDTFFFLSGLLVVMVALRSMEKSNGKLNVPLMYLHRYLRLTPVLALAILFYMKILPLMGSGPVSDSSLNSNIDTCHDSWFYTLLYVQNYAVSSNMCLGHSWYLAVDMQFYIISPLLLIALYKWGKKAVAGIVVLMLLLCACLITTMVTQEIVSSPLSAASIYMATHLRASPWIIGLLFGYYLHLNGRKPITLNRLTVCLGWIISLGLMFTCLFALYPYSKSGEEVPIVADAFYVTLTRVAWPLALVWVVFACKYGYGGMANSFLSSPLWQPLSKLSYCAYIWHVFIQLIHAGNTRTNTYFSNYEVMMRFWSDFGFTLILAYVMFVIIEAPSGSLKLLLCPRQRSKPLSSRGASTNLSVVEFFSEL